MCAKAGLVEVGVIAIDGTKISANASMARTAAMSGSRVSILEEAEETDRWEDELYRAGAW